MTDLKFPEVPVGVQGTPIPKLAEEAVTPTTEVVEETAKQVQIVTPDIEYALKRGVEAEELLKILCFKEEPKLPEYITSMPEGNPKEAATHTFWNDVHAEDEDLDQRIRKFFE